MKETGDIEILTKCKEIVSQQVKFLRKNDEYKLTYYPYCKERWFETESKNGTNVCKQCTSCKKLHPNIADFPGENDCDPFPDGCDYPHKLSKLSVVGEL